MHSGKSGFIGGFVAASVLCGAVAAFCIGELYTPNSGGDWIRDPLVYAPGTADQINVLGDLAPGAAETMFDVGMRLNVLSSAVKKQNWEVADFEAGEIEEAFDRLMVTRPLLTTDLENFLTSSVAPMIAAIATNDKTSATNALETLTAGCNSCHTSNGVDFMVVKPGKSGLPLKL